MSLSCHFLALLASSSTGLLLWIKTFLPDTLSTVEHADTNTQGRSVRWNSMEQVRLSLFLLWLLLDELFLWQALCCDASSIRIIPSEARGNGESLGSYNKQRYNLKYRFKHGENGTTRPLLPLSFLSSHLTSLIVLFLSRSWYPVRIKKICLSVHYENIFYLLSFLLSLELPCPRLLSSIRRTKQQQNTNFCRPVSSSSASFCFMPS